MRYGVDGSFNLSDGVMKGTERNRYSAGFSLDYRMKNFQIKNYVSFTHTKSKASPYGSFSVVPEEASQPKDTFRLCFSLNVRV